MNPLVSILVPAFNAGPWIADSIRSALAQTWEPKEIIVVDDGSRDRTLEIAKQFESDVVRVVSQKNRGAAAARNLALSFSKGDYIQWLDADDLLSPDKIARQMEVLRARPNERALASCEFGRFIHNPKRSKFVATALWHDMSPAEFMRRKLGQNLFMQTAVWLVSRELTQKAGPWNTDMLTDDDGEYFGRVLMHSDEIRFVQDAKVYYRASGGGRLSYIGQSSRRLEAQWISMQLQIGYLESLEDNERSRAACVYYLQTWIEYFYPDRPDIVQQMEQAATALGGKLYTPRLPWKYWWIQKTLGWRAAKSARLYLPRVRWNLESQWDRMTFRMQDHVGLRTPEKNNR